MTLPELIEKLRRKFLEHLDSCGEDHTKFYNPLTEEGENGETLKTMGVEIREPDAHHEAWLSIEGAEPEKIWALRLFADYRDKWTKDEDGAAYVLQGNPVSLRFDNNDDSLAAMIYTNPIPGVPFTNVQYTMALSVLFNEMSELTR